MFTIASAFLKERFTKHTNSETQESQIVYNGTGFARLVSPGLDAQVNYRGRPVESFYHHSLLLPKGHEITITEEEGRVFSVFLDNPSRTIELKGSQQASITCNEDYIVINVPNGSIVDVRTDNSRIPIIFNIVDE